MKFIVFTLIFIISTVIFAEGFPLRKKYPDLKTISTAELKSQYESINIVDVRSKMEYSVVHIKKALFVPVSNNKFENSIIKKFKDKNTKIAFYCNGHSCAKSYKATKRMKAKGYTNVFVYESGIFEWTKENPKLSVLLDKSPANSSKLISKDKFNERLLGFKDFKEKVSKSNSVLIDIREAYQKFNPNKKSQKYNLPKLAIKAKKIPFSKVVKNVINKKINKDKTMFFYDATGKQVRWLQYYLEKQGYDNYFFLKGGVKIFYK